MRYPLNIFVRYSLQAGLKILQPMLKKILHLAGNCDESFFTPSEIAFFILNEILSILVSIFLDILLSSALPAQTVADKFFASSE